MPNKYEIDPKDRVRSSLYNTPEQYHYINCRVCKKNKKTVMWRYWVCSNCAASRSKLEDNIASYSDPETLIYALE